jgi:hypothetical protein
MDTVVVFDPTGKYFRSFGKEYFYGGHGIDLRKEGSEEFLYLSNNAPREGPRKGQHGDVIKTTLQGEVVWKKLGPPPETDVYEGNKPYSPTNIAFAPDGGFYVADGYGSHYIHQYDRDARYVRTWGGAGMEPGKLQTPHGLWLDDRPGREPALVVADRANARLQYFTLDGRHQGFVYDMLLPAHFDIRGDVLLVPDLQARVTLLDRDNEPIVHLGDDLAWRKEVKKLKIRTDPRQWRPGKFVHPHDACFDKDGNIFVVEWVDSGRITLLRQVG